MYSQLYKSLKLIINMDTIIVVGEAKYTTLKKVKRVSDNVWSIDDLNEYCTKNKMTMFNLDDYCDLINGYLSEDNSINLNNIYISYCFTKN